MKRKLRIIIPIFLCLLVAHGLQAQERPSFKGPIAYLETGICLAPLGTKGTDVHIVPIFAISGEYIIFKTKKLYCNAHAGYGSYHDNGFRIRTIPVGIIFFNGMGKSHIEGGVGLSYTEGIQQGYSGSTMYPSQAYYFVPSIGYRFQKPTGGLFIKVTYAPYLKIKEVSDHVFKGYYNQLKKNQNFTIALGYFFSRKERHVN